jgi:hypothetical protein
MWREETATPDARHKSNRGCKNTRVAAGRSYGHRRRSTSAKQTFVGDKPIMDKFRRPSPRPTRDRLRGIDASVELVTPSLAPRPPQFAETLSTNCDDESSRNQLHFGGALRRGCLLSSTSCAIGWFCLEGDQPHGDRSAWRNLASPLRGCVVKADGPVAPDATDGRLVRHGCVFYHGCTLNATNWVFWFCRTGRRTRRQAHALHALDFVSEFESSSEPELFARANFASPERVRDVP